MVGKAGRNRGVVHTFLWCATIVLVAWVLADVAGRYLELGAPGSATGSSPAMLASLAALAIAVAAIAVAVGALQATRRARRELNVITRSLDLALRSRFDARGNPGSTGVKDRNAPEAEAAGPAREGRARDARQAAGHLSLVRDPRDAVSPPERSASDVEARLADAVARGIVEISLRPIVSLARGAAAGFDVFAHFEREAGEPVDIGRVAERSGIDLAAFERMLVLETMTAWQRIAGNDGDVRLHVPVSGALLASAPDVALVLRMARVYPAAATSIVFDLPAALFADGVIETDVVNRLANAGIAFAIEVDGTIPRASLPNLGWMRIPSRMLLANGTGGTDVLHGAGLTVIADDVRSDDDAIALADLGVDLMVGPRFSGPRRLRGEDPAASRHAAE